jgi:N-acetylneuraminate lyase
MHEDGSLNLALVEPYVKHLLNSGVKHVFVNGTTGEAHSLTVEERKAVAEAWVKHGRSKLDRIIVHCGTGSLTETKELIKHAASIGVDAIAVVGPTYFKPANMSDLVDYCAEAAMEAPDTPFMYYHIPALTGINIRITDFIKQAHEKIPNLIGAKFTSSDLQDASTASVLFNSKYDIIIGCDGMALGALSMGLPAFIGITFNLLGKPFNRLIKAFDSGDLKKAREEQIYINEFLDMSGCVGNINTLLSTLKALTSEYFPSLKLGPTRKPITPVSPDQLHKIKANLDKINFKKAIE